MNVTEMLKVRDNTPEEFLDYGQLYQKLDEDIKEKIENCIEVIAEAVTQIVNVIAEQFVPFFARHGMY